jgi:hypothetical protein
MKTPSAEPVSREWPAPPRNDQRSLVVLLVLLGVYVCVHVLCRWLNYAIWYGDEFYSARVPTVFEIVYYLYMACLPTALWGLLLYVAASRFPRVFRPGGIALGVLVCLVFFEIDMKWYQMSRHHVRWSDVQAVFGQDWQQDLGLRDSDYWSFGVLLGTHALVCGLIWLSAPWLARKRLLQRLPAVRLRVFAAVVVCLTMLDCAAVRYFAGEVNHEDGYSQWQDLAQRNPIRLRALDDLVNAVSDRFSERQADLEEANAIYASLETPAGDARLPRTGKPLPPARDGRPYHVVVVGVESLNFRLVHATDMPFFREFSRRCLRLDNHYSTGNCTHYGLLGFFYGSPVSFFNGHVTGERPRSPYLDLFRSHGYRSRVISMALLGHHYMGDYLPNFTEKTYVGATDQSLLPVFRREMARPGPHFTFVFYNGTHFPYSHAADVTPFTPEAPEDFDYSGWDVLDHLPLIVNRYKNCLLEFDGWLRALLRDVDWQRTIVVLMGDHGEEFFEDGRLGHGSSFNRAQTHTPCLLYLPGVPGRRVTTLTSHADLLPSVVDALGWQAPAHAGLGRSLFRRGADRVAFIAQQNYKKRPDRWAVVTEGRKAILEGDAAADLRITSLLSPTGKHLLFHENPDAWLLNFRHIKRFQATLP